MDSREVWESKLPKKLLKQTDEIAKRLNLTRKQVIDIMISRELAKRLLKNIQEPGHGGS